MHCQAPLSLPCSRQICILVDWLNYADLNSGATGVLQNVGEWPKSQCSQRRNLLVHQVSIRKVTALQSPRINESWQHHRIWERHRPLLNMAVSRPDDGHRRIQDGKNRWQFLALQFIRNATREKRTAYLQRLLLSLAQNGNRFSADLLLRFGALLKYRSQLAVHCAQDTTVIIVKTST